MRVLAIIPARGGSKGIPNKNIRMFGGKPLLSYAIDVAKQSRYIKRIIVSTDSQKIATVAKKYGGEVPFLRPPELSTDKSLVKDAVHHLLAKLKTAEGYEPDVIVLLQPTSPLRYLSDVDGALSLMQKRKAPAVMTICRTEQLVFTKGATDVLQLESNKKFLASSNRQQLPPTYKLDGPMVAAIRTKIFLKGDSFMPKGTVGYEIPRWRAVDLDEPQDVLAGELLFKHRKHIEHSLTHFQ